jgi:murein DD-endopeptidase MepM/ murein hydrolase activator NlpD
VLDYTPKARRKRSRWRRLVPLVVGVLIVGGSVAALARTTPAAATGSPDPALVGVVASLAPSAPSDGAARRSPDASPPSVAQATSTPIPTPTPIPTAPAIATLTGYQWPLPNGRLTLPFGASPWGSRIVDGEKFHDGLDLATFCGDHVLAAHDGVVLAASRKFDDYIGWIGDLKSYVHRLDLNKLWSTLPIVVVIDDGNGYRSIYAHFSKVVVKRGDTVKAGDFIGYEGMTGRASGCHVHYGLFSPLETATFGIDPAVVKKLRVPAIQLARIDPLQVLPPRPQDQPSASPGLSASPAPTGSPVSGASPSGATRAPSPKPGATP